MTIHKQSENKYFINQQIIIKVIKVITLIKVITIIITVIILIWIIIIQTIYLQDLDSKNNHIIK